MKYQLGTLLVFTCAVSLVACNKKDVSKSKTVDKPSEEILKKPPTSKKKPNSKPAVLKKVTLIKASLKDLYVRALKLNSGQVNETLNLMIGKLGGGERDIGKRAVLLLVLAMAESDHEAFMSLVGPNGVTVGSGKVTKKGLKLIQKTAKLIPRDQVATEIKQPGSYLGILTPDDINDANIADWIVRERTPGIIEVSANGTNAVAHLKRQEGAVWLDSVLSFEPVD